ncbi:MAG: energy transducer TonB [Maricaulaceae bacterium]
MKHKHFICLAVTICTLIVSLNFLGAGSLKTKPSVKSTRPSLVQKKVVIFKEPNWEFMMNIRTSQNPPRDAQPWDPPRPQYPEGATRSGHCKFSVHIDAYGEPINVYDAKCSDPIFLENSKKAIFQRRYPPKIIDGKAVHFHTQTQITFKLTDERGNIIPE